MEFRYELSPIQYDLSSFRHILITYRKSFMRKPSKPGAGRARKDAENGSKPNEMMAAVAAVTLIIGGIGAFLIWNAMQPKRTPIEMLVGVDVTTSVGQKQRQKCFGVFDTVIDSALPQQTHLRFWTYDVNSREQAAVETHKSRDLWDMEDKMISTSRSDTKGTFQNNVMKDMILAVKEAGKMGKNCACMLLTDGEDTDPKATDREVAELASLPNVRAVWFEGVNGENGTRSNLERRLKPILGDKLIMTSENDSQTGLDQFQKLIDRK